ncbi:hypothetical protein [Salinivibrio socompensis]|uniref:hypothetical protein n=1 Tax=Salinivibrio socompensis TaxID=1510206 RepID=UPI00046F2F89|nr:hypothetical protein [Salinivibrio socompensis]
MATLNQAVQSMIDNLHQKMTSDTPLTPEEQTLVAKALEALRNNYTWEQALVAVAEHHINESKAALESALTDTQAANTALENKTSELVSRYSHLRVVGSSAEINIYNGRSHTFTPPPGCRVRVKELFAYDRKNGIDNVSGSTAKCRMTAGGVPILGSNAKEYSFPVYVGGKATGSVYIDKYIRVGDAAPSNTKIYPASHSEVLLGVDESFYIKAEKGGTNGVCIFVEYVTDK